MTLDFPRGERITLEALAADPYPLLEDLRVHEPVTWAPALGRWLVSRRDLAIAVLGDVERCTTDDPRSTIASTFGRQMLSSEGADQRRQRAPFVPAFRP